MNTKIENGDHTVVLMLEGEIGMNNGTALRRLLFEPIEIAKNLLVDLSGVVSMDSSAIANLIEALQEAKAKGVGFALVSVPPKVLRVIELLRLGNVFSFHTDRQAARLAKTASPASIS